MVRRIVQTEQAPAPVGPYNQAIVASGEMVFASGQVALDPSSGAVVVSITSVLFYRQLGLPWPMWSKHPYF